MNSAAYHAREPAINSEMSKCRTSQANRQRMTSMLAFSFAPFAWEERCAELWEQPFCS
jgi:hypothetical protein